MAALTDSIELHYVFSRIQSSEIAYSPHSYTTSYYFSGHRILVLNRIFQNVHNMFIPTNSVTVIIPKYVSLLT